MIPASGKISDYDAQWKCATCGHGHVVPSLARDCEARHESGNGHASS